MVRGALGLQLLRLSELGRHIAEAGVGWVRSFDGAQPQAALMAAQVHQLLLSGIVFYSKGSPARFPLDDLPGFESYVSKRLTETQGKVRHWEVWNEPPNFSEDKSPQSYAFVFRGPTPPLVAWAAPGRSAHVELGASVRDIDPRTGQSRDVSAIELTGSPRILASIPAALVDAARANRVRPFPTFSPTTARRCASR